MDPNGSGPKFTIGIAPILLVAVALLLIPLILESQVKYFGKSNLSRALEIVTPEFLLAGVAVFIRSVTQSETKTLAISFGLLALLLLMTLCSYAPTAG